MFLKPINKVFKKMMRLMFKWFVFVNKQNILHKKSLESKLYFFP